MRHARIEGERAGGQRLHVLTNEELVGTFTLGFAYGIAITALNVLVWWKLREVIR